MEVYLKRKIEELKNNIELLKKNETQVDRYLLRSKYRTSYISLMNDVVANAAIVLLDITIQGLWFVNGEDKCEFADYAARSILTPEFQKEILHAIQDGYSYEKFLEFVYSRGVEEVVKVYAPYFHEHTYLTQSGRYYNLLLDKYWNEDCFLWENQKGEEYRFCKAIPFNGRVCSFSNPYQIAFKGGELVHVA